MHDQKLVKLYLPVFWVSVIHSARSQKHRTEPKGLSKGELSMNGRNSSKNLKKTGSMADDKIKCGFREKIKVV